MAVIDFLLRNGAEWVQKDSNMMLPEGYMTVHGDESVMEFKRLCQEEEKRRKDLVDEKQAHSDALRALDNEELAWARDLAGYMKLERQKECTIMDPDLDRTKSKVARISKAQKRENKKSWRKNGKCFLL